jgi:Domain of unknown function (DUF6542)
VAQDSLQRHQPTSPAGEVMAPARMTGRGSVLAMFAVFFVATAVSELLHLGFLVGIGLVTGCVLTARFARRSALLVVVVTPPLIFLVALVCAEAVTSSSTTGHSGFLAAAEGTILTLAAAAPWLFASVGISIVLALFRGLPQCVRELRASLRGR